MIIFFPKKSKLFKKLSIFGLIFLCFPSPVTIFWTVICMTGLSEPPFTYQSLYGPFSSSCYFTEKLTLVQKEGWISKNSIVKPIVAFQNQNQNQNQIKPKIQFRWFSIHSRVNLRLGFQMSRL